MRLPDYVSTRVLVVGDLILDRYWHGSTSRISPEAPVPVVHVRDDELRVGGAGNVAVNITALGGSATLMGFCGVDEASKSLQQLLQQANINCKLQHLDNFPTITKLRVMSRNQQLIRLDFEDGFHQVNADRLLNDFAQVLQQTQVVVLSDYGKGTLSKVAQFIALANNSNKPVLIDPKGADFSVYQKATLITPNLSEFAAVVGHIVSQQQMVECGMNLLNKLELQGLLITKGEQGVTLLLCDEPPLHLPTHAREVYDVTGAGDTIISIVASSIAAGKSLAEATILANIGAGIVVGKMGTASIHAEEMQYALSGQRAHYRGVIALNSLALAIAKTHKEGGKVVLTNGCFDILHPGHVRYLQKAKQLGDRLVVLVNSDASVQRLKGANRPINALKQRMEMLAALECVDWVTAFDADTPKEMIDQLLPDILVKGGDYEDIKQIAGYASVIANGGIVKILSFSKGHSTTNIIKSIKVK